MNSREEQESAREWLGSMMASARSGSQEEVSVATNAVSDVDGDGGLNIMA